MFKIFCFFYNRLLDSITSNDLPLILAISLIFIFEVFLYLPFNALGEEFSMITSARRAFHMATDSRVKLISK